MIFTTKNLILSKEDILSRITEEDIFRFYIKSFIQEGKPFCSELRRDEKPSCTVKETDSYWRYKDFATGETLDCFGYVMKKFKINFIECINIISNDFNLGLHNKTIKKINTEILGIHRKEKKHTSIQVKKRQWNDNDTYWFDYHITRDLLDLYNIVPVEYYWINGRLKYHYVKTNPCYSLEHDEYKKLLMPYSKYKWLSNVPAHIFSGYNQLDWLSDILVITKSLKDCIIWRMFGINAIAPQGETYKIQKDFIERLKKRFERIYCNYDNDEVGKYWALILGRNYNIESIFIPEDSNCKDISDYIKKYGKIETKCLIQKMNGSLR